MVKTINEEVNRENREMTMIIYKAVFPNGKVYIGQTIRTLKERMIQHKKDSKFKKFIFYKAIRKYGWNNIVWVILEQCEEIDELNKREEYWIWKLKSCVNFKESNGYNLTLGGRNSYKLGFFTVEELIQFGEDYRKGMLKNDMYNKYNKNGNISRRLFSEFIQV